MPKKAKAKPTKSKPKKTEVKLKPVSARAKTSKLSKLNVPKRIKSARIEHKAFGPAGPKPKNIFGLFKRTISIMFEEKRFFLITLLIYGVLTIIFVKGFGSTDFAALKTSLHSIVHGTSGQARANLSIFGLLISSSGSTTSASASIYQTLLFFIFSLVTIFGLRQNFAAKKLKVKDAFYRGMYPVIPFILICLLILLETLPLFIGLFLYSAVITDGVAVHIYEQVIWIAICLSLASLTIFLLTSSLFSLYVVALPDIKPMQALRSARRLVRYRRWSIIRKLFFLPVSIVIVLAIVMIPIITLAPAATYWVFLVLSLWAVLFANTYLYLLYRELLDE